MTLRVVYAGTPDFACPALKALLQADYSVVGVYTQPDRPSGRGRKIVFGPVKQMAVDADITVYQPETLKTEAAQEALKALKPDVMVVAAYGLILPQVVLDIPRYGCLNIHGSLLPRWRGAAPIHRAIQQGDKETGVTIMQMAAGLDTGDMLAKKVCPITSQDTSGSIHDQLASDGAELLLDVLEKMRAGKLNPEVQDESQVTYAHKLNKQEAIIDWASPAIEIDRMIRAFNPWPVAVTSHNNKPLKCLMSEVNSSFDNTHSNPGEVVNESSNGIEVATGQGSVLIHRLQIPGKKAMDVKDFLNGRSLLGATLGVSEST